MFPQVRMFTLDSFMKKENIAIKNLQIYEYIKIQVILHFIINMLRDIFFSVLKCWFTLHLSYPSYFQYLCLT